MPTYRASLQFPYDSALPRDVISVNPHFSSPDPDALAGALSANLTAWGPTATKPHTIKIYDATKAPPSYPLATRVVAGTPGTSSAPREVALCLSYFSTYNRPRYRGRLYLPSSWLTSSPSVRPTALIMSNAKTFATDVLTKTLPPSTNWVVWSHINQASYGVTDYWIDDEWDTVRSRGMKSTTRQSGQV
jgi:hypothetical protein